MQNLDGIIIMYDICDHFSFMDAENFLFRLAKARKLKHLKNVPCYLVGNKLDLQAEREVLKVDAQAMSSKHQVKCMETSAKEGINVTLVMQDLVMMVLKQFAVKTRKPLIESVSRVYDKKKQSTCATM